MLSSNSLARAFEQAQVWPAVRVILAFRLSLPQMAHCLVPLTSWSRSQHQSLMKSTDITLIAPVSEYNRHSFAEFQKPAIASGGFLPNSLNMVGSEGLEPPTSCL
jgi:hypothetical protein